MRKILVTGSEGTIGKEIVKYFSDYYDVVRLDKKLGHDLTNVERIKNIFVTTDDIYAVILLHAYNPTPTEGAEKIEPIDVPLEELRDYFEINVFSVFAMCSEYIRNHTGGRIINVSSLYGLRSPKHFIYRDYVKPIGYSLTKSSIISMTKYLATYYSPDFLINSVVLGGLHDPQQDSVFQARYSEQSPIGRLMEKTELISVFEFLLDERNTYTNGSEVIVDGGWLAW